MQNSKQWPETVPIIEQQELEAYSYRYAYNYSSNKGIWCVFYKQFPHHMSECMSHYLIVYAFTRHLQLDTATQFNLVACCLGYVEGQSPTTITLFNEVKESYVRYQAWKSRENYCPPRTTNNVTTRRSNRKSCLALFRDQKNITDSNDDKVLPPPRHHRISLAEWRSKNKLTNPINPTNPNNQRKQ